MNLLEEINIGIETYNHEICNELDQISSDKYITIEEALLINRGFNRSELNHLMSAGKLDFRLSNGEVLVDSYELTDLLARHLYFKDHPSA